MKRILLLFSALMLSCIALWAHDVEIGDIYYNLNETNKTAEVTYRGDDESDYDNEYSGSVTIPETITYNSEIYSVTSIGRSAFYDCSGLTSVTIPNSVTSIGYAAFYSCSGLTEVTIPNSVTSIDYKAFYDCSGLTSVSIGKSVTSIYNETFFNTGFYNSESNWDNGVLYIDNCLIDAKSDVVKGSYTIKEGTRLIGNNAFSGCSGLTSVTIPNSVTSISSAAFYNCSGLTSVTIPNSVTSIGNIAFYSCSGLTSITIPNSVTSIGWGAFSGCSGLTSVTIPNSVTSIDYEAFSGCSGLTSITIPNSVTSIDDETFYNCSGLTSVTIPNSVTSIGEDAFYNTGIYNNNSNWDNGVLYIDNCLIKAKSDIVKGSYTIKEGTRIIGEHAFYSCIGLTSVTIGESVTSIGSYAFSGCSGLTSVIWNAKNCAEFEVYFETPFYYIRSSITSFTFGNKVEHIPADLCYGMSKLTEITIPNSVTSIGHRAFYECSGLTSVTIGNSVTSIGSYAFDGCSGLTEVTIGNSVTSFGRDAFSGCSGLTSVIWNAKHCKDFGRDSYYVGINSPFYNIRSSITSFIFGNEVEHIPADLCYGMSKLTEITIPNSVTSIGSYAFSGCSGLTEVTIPNGVTSIGSYAFSGCSGLTKVNYLRTVDKWVEIDFKDSRSNPTYYAKDLYINNELITDVKITTADSIKNYAFYNCQSFKSVEIGNSVTSIGDEAFYNCSGLTSVTIGNSVTSIGSSAFYSCSGLTSVTIGNSVTSIGEDAFDYCSGLTKVNYLGTVDKWVEIDFKSSNDNPTYYAKDLYINNELLTDVKITTADSIKNYAFYNCQSIKSVEIGESVTSIGSSAFSGCDKLRKVTAYPTTVPNVYESSFAHYNAALYVPCDVYDDYFFDEVWGTFKVTDCIAAEEVDAPEKVEIEVDEDNNANVIWPSTDGAKKYELEISKDGEVFCTLLFNENGQLTSIDFGNRSASVGFQFTVTGLDGASKYAYSMVAMDKKGNELQSYKGTFTTNGYVPGPGEEEEPVSITETLADANITVSGGTISADADFSIYNTIGQNVTAFNGSLQAGVYLVSIENNIVKVMVK